MPRVEIVFEAMVFTVGGAVGMAGRVSVSKCTNHKWKVPKGLGHIVSITRGKYSTSWL